jgi:penicillin amidase
MLKKLLYALLGLAALAVAALGSGLLYLRTARPDVSGEHTLAGLSHPVEVWRDSLGVPHLWADGEADLFRAMGYVHAQDRFWQMELFRRVADGRMAEILGPRMVDTDRFLRTVGMGRAAAETERTLDPRSRALLQAYADGVNAWIRGHRGALPPEFVVLRFSPEPWTVRHSLAIGKIMAWDLADWSIGLDLQRAVDAVGPERARDLVPAYPEWGADILGADATWRGKAGAPAAVPTAAAKRPAAPAAPAVPKPVPGGATGVGSPELRAGRVPVPYVPREALALLEGSTIAHASNSWVIGGSRTRSGKPILANDMHLSLRAPSLWYLAALHGGGFNVTGMTLPGVPVVVAGHSDRVAWAYTNAMVDDTDFFIEQTDPADSTRYRTPDGWARFEVRPETIRVKGAEPVLHHVRVSRHGPILSDVDPRGGDRVLAMQWTAQRPSGEVDALMEMNRARSAEEFEEALRGFGNPHQNVVFADADGNFGYHMGGTVPVRRSGDGLLPAPGWTGEADWVRTLDFDEKPRVMNPAEGFIVTANNRQLGPGSGYPFRISSNFFPPYRALRIRQMIETGRAFTADDVARQQMDVQDPFALRHLARAVRAADAAGERQAAAELRAWNGRAELDSRAAALFYSWFEALRRRVGEDEFRGKPMYFPRSTLEAILEAGDSPWVDDVTTPQRETLAELSAAAMTEAVASAGGKSWGELHATVIEHPLGVVGALNRTLGLNVGPFPNRGSGNTVNVAGYGGTRPPFTNSYGPSQRHVVDMADPDGAGGFVLPTGQSGLPFSVHYQDQTPLWREGRLWRVPLDRRKAEARAVDRMILRPGAR